MATILQTTFSNEFSRKKYAVFWFNFLMENVTRGSFVSIDVSNETMQTQFTDIFMSPGVNELNLIKNHCAPPGWIYSNMSLGHNLGNFSS